MRNPNAMSKIVKIIGISELFLAALAAIVCLASFKTAFFPSEGTHWETPGWALMNFLIITPFALSVAISGAALIKSFKWKWLYHIFPVIILIGVVIFFWWADVGSMK